LVTELRDFTLKGYAELLQHLGKSYKIIPLCALPQKAVPYVILRHDVDFSLSAALRMARLEKKLGITATYFVLFSDRLYNLHESANVQTVRQISELGHEIGLHYDPTEYQFYGVDLEETLRIEIELLEHLLCKKVFSIARHGPWVRDPFAAIKGYINANDPRWRGDLYIHDSCRAWTPPDALFVLFTNPPKRVQLLVHAENWNEEKIRTEALLDGFFNGKEKENRVFRKELDKWWFREPDALKHDAETHKTPRSSSQPISKLNLPHARSPSEKLKARLKWYLINTRIGWGVHKIAERARTRQASLDSNNK
jgi:hypothetical protein